MPTNYDTPGVYVEEVSSGAKPIEPVGTSTAGFVGVAPKASARLNEAVALNNWSEFVKNFWEEGCPSTPLSHGVYGFFINGGSRCYVVNIGKDGDLTSGGTRRKGLEVLEPIDEIAVVAAPGYCDAGAYSTILGYCERLQDRVAVLDTHEHVDDLEQLKKVATANKSSGSKKDKDNPKGAGKPGLRPPQSDGGYGSLYYPWIRVKDPFNPKEIVNVPPSGYVAGIYARSDGKRGVHKAPANENVFGALGLTYRVTHAEQGELNVNGVNCIRYFPKEGIRIWGARTLAPSSSEWRYLNVRRLFNMIEESIGQSTRWVVFEPNDLNLWKCIRRDVSSFLKLIWRSGALMGASPEEAFFVKCDAETNPPEVVDAGRVVTLIGIAPVKPAEFVIFRIGQHAGGVEVSES